MKFGHELQPFSFVRSTRSLTLSSYICDFGADIRPVARDIEGNLFFFSVIVFWSRFKNELRKLSALLPPN